MHGRKVQLGRNERVAVITQNGLKFGNSRNQSVDGDMQQLAARLRSLAVFAASLVAIGGSAASAATLCVNPNPRAGCAYTTIGAAVSAAASGDTIDVAPGRYNEDVHITRPVALIGSGAGWTVINATGLANGIFIDGINGAPTITPGSNMLRGVTVTGFTVQNANFEGILALNASNVTLWANLVAGNDRALNVSNSTCPGLPVFETNEEDDCGEGIHLLGSDHSLVASNTVENKCRRHSAERRYRPDQRQCDPGKRGAR
jgi:hypothetical protein